MLLKNAVATSLLFLSFSFTASSLPIYAETESGKLKFETHFVKPQMTEKDLAEAISVTEKSAQKLVDEDVVPGLAITIVYKDKVVYSKGFGVRVVGSSDKVDADTVFQLASLSKSLASSTLSALMADSKINWDSKICDLDPDFQMYDPWVSREITLRDFFSHRSGLPDHACDVLEDIGYDRAQVLHRMRFQKPDSSFRTHYAYTNFGLTEGGVAAAKSFGKSWEDLSEDKLYKPMGMTSTSSRFADYQARSNKALGHVRVNGKWVHKYQRDPDAQSPAGGASSSVNDMAKWMRMQIANGKYEGKQIAQEKALAETHHPQMSTKFSPVDNLPSFYGLGFNVSYDQQGRLRLGHSGAFSLGASTCFSMIPDEQLGICVLTNVSPIGVAEAISSTFIDTALYGHSTQDWYALYKQIFSNPAEFGVSTSPYSTPKTSPLPALSNNAYLGKYRNDLYGDLGIIEKNGALVLTIGPKEYNFSLKHYDRDTFTFESESEDLSGVTAVTFTTCDGKATDVVLDTLNEFGQGSFKRASN